MRTALTPRTRQWLFLSATLMMTAYALVAYTRSHDGALLVQALASAGLAYTSIAKIGKPLSASEARDSGFLNVCVIVMVGASGFVLFDRLLR